MGKEYKQLAVEDRSIIAVGLEQGLSRRPIGRLLISTPGVSARSWKIFGGSRSANWVPSR